MVPQVAAKAMLLTKEGQQGLDSAAFFSAVLKEFNNQQRGPGFISQDQVEALFEELGLGSTAKLYRVRNAGKGIFWDIIRRPSGQVWKLLKPEVTWDRLGIKRPDHPLRVPITPGMSLRAIRAYLNAVATATGGGKTLARETISRKYTGRCAATTWQYDKLAGVTFDRDFFRITRTGKLRHASRTRYHGFNQKKSGRVSERIRSSGSAGRRSQKLAKDVVLYIRTKKQLNAIPWSQRGHVVYCQETNHQKRINIWEPYFKNIKFSKSKPIGEGGVGVGSENNKSSKTKRRTYTKSDFGLTDFTFDLLKTTWKAAFRRNLKSYRFTLEWLLKEFQCRDVAQFNAIAFTKRRGFEFILESLHRSPLNGDYYEARAFNFQIYHVISLEGLTQVWLKRDEEFFEEDRRNRIASWLDETFGIRDPNSVDFDALFETPGYVPPPKLIVPTLDVQAFTKPTKKVQPAGNSSNNKTVNADTSILDEIYRKLELLDQEEPAITPEKQPEQTAKFPHLQAILERLNDADLSQSELNQQIARELDEVLG